MRALLIEGDSITTQSIEAMLKSDGICMEATDLGEDGLDLCRRYDYDVVILNLRLPDMSGFDVIRALRRARIDIPILAVTAAAPVENQVKALNLGADGCMTTPFHKDELVARIRALVRRSRGISQPKITAGPVEIDLSSKSVTAGGVGLRLTYMEYQVLELLSLRYGVTQSKEAIISHLYANGDGPESRTIELFICRLRKKLASATGGDRCIETVGRWGYMLGPACAA